MSTADEINLKARAAWPIVESLREKFDQALNEQIDNVLLSSWPSSIARRHRTLRERVIAPFIRRRGPRGRRLALKTRCAWLPRSFGVDWGYGDRSALVIHRGREIVSVTEIDKILFDPKA